MATDDGYDRHLKPCMLLQPADEFWPATVDGGIELHAHGDGDVCDPHKCCVVASLDGLVETNGAA